MTRSFCRRALAHAAAAAGIVGLAGAIPVRADVPGSCTTTWLGNTYGKGGQPTDTGQLWMQDYIDQMTVQPDGTVYTTSGWDEGGRDHGVYKDGQVLGNQDHGINGRALSVGGHTWSVSGNSVTSDDGRSISGLGSPTAVGATSDGKLLIADNGPNKQIYFYDVSGSPTRVDTFGAQGGIGRPSPPATTCRARPMRRDTGRGLTGRASTTRSNSRTSPASGRTPAGVCSSRSAAARRESAASSATPATGGSSTGAWRRSASSMGSTSSRGRTARRSTASRSITSSTTATRRPAASGRSTPTPPTPSPTLTTHGIF